MARSPTRNSRRSTTNLTSRLQVPRTNVSSFSMLGTVLAWTNSKRLPAMATMTLSKRHMTHSIEPERPLTNLPKCLLRKRAKLEKKLEKASSTNFSLNSLLLARLLRAVLLSIRFGTSSMALPQAMLISVRRMLLCWNLS